MRGHVEEIEYAGFSGSFGEFVVAAWRLVVPWWRSEEKLLAFAYLAGDIALQLSLVYFSLLRVNWNADFFDALEQQNASDVFKYGLHYLLILVGMIVLTFVLTHVQLGFLIRWRRWMTSEALSRYLDRYAYNGLEDKRYGIDNPDQRLAEDIRNLATETLELGSQLLSSTARIGTFVTLLWVLSGTLEITLFETDLQIPGYMVWAVIGYTLLSTWIVHKVSSPLARLNNRQQAYEAEFRKGLVRVRENAESIALLNGEAREGDALDSRFRSIRDNWLRLRRYTVRFTGLSDAVLSIGTVFPVAINVPRVISGELSLGGLMQMWTAFAYVKNALLWFVTSYDRLAQWKASVDRLLRLNEALEQAQADVKTSRIVRESGDTQSLHIDSLSVRLPNGTALLNDGTLDLQAGENVLLSGQSGSGKTTLFRALSGIWPWGEGKVSLPGKTLFMPQKVYIPHGSLIDAICYPADASNYDRDEVVRLMHACGLQDLGSQLDKEAYWDKILSGGEQQRVSLLRALLARPDWLFLDEATAALDPERELALYALLDRELPETTIVSIAHRTDLQRHHDRHVRIHNKQLSEA